MLCSERIHGLDVTPDGSVVIGGCDKVVIAHDTVTGAVLWRNDTPGKVRTFCIHGDAVVVPFDNCNTVVLDVTTGHQIHTLPSTGECVSGLCVFDGLIRDVIFSVDFLTPCYLSAANEGSIKGG